MSFPTADSGLKSSQAQTPLILRILALAGGIIATWIVAIFEPTTLLFLLIVPTLLIRWLLRRRWIAAVVYFLALPTSFAAYGAVAGYCSGDGCLKSMGLPGTRFHNQHPIHRCDRSTGGCIVWGNEWLFELPYNTTLIAMIHTFGYMPGSYDGPHPTEAEAKQALAAEVPIDWKTLEDDRVVVGDVATQLDSGVGKRLSDGYARQLQWESYLIESARRRIPPVTGAIWRDRCLILEIPAENYSSSSNEKSAMIVVFDRECGRPFAYYEVGDYSHHFPPVEWRKRD